VKTLGVYAGAGAGADAILISYDSNRDKQHFGTHSMAWRPHDLPSHLEYCSCAWVCIN